MKILAEIFTDRDNAHSILEEILKAGVAGICGGRVAVRKKLKEIRNIAEHQNNKNIHAHSTINHPYTELAYVYDVEKFSHQEAKHIVERSYTGQDLVINGNRFI